MSALRLLAVLALVLAASGRAAAEPPAGDYEIAITEPQIWVPVESDPAACATELGITLCLDELNRIQIGPQLFDMTNGSGGVAANVIGHVSGALTPLLDPNDVPRPFGGSLAGDLSGPPERRKALLRLGMGGLLEYGGLPVASSLTGKVRCEASGGAAFACVARTKLCVTESGRRLGCVQHEIPVPFPQAGGAWELRLNDLATDVDGRVAGSAVVELANAQGFGYVVAGKYDADRDTANLQLRGVGTSTRSRIKLSRLRLGDGGAQAGQMVFRIANQKGKVDLEGAP